MIRGGVGWVMAALAVAAALMIHSRLPWVPLIYLAALIVLGVTGWRLIRWRSGHGVARWLGLATIAAAFIALCPVPWMHAELEHPPGSAWRLDGNLTVGDAVVDPPGRWYWLTAGRPPLVAEAVYDMLAHEPGGPRSLTHGRPASTPRVSEPAAAAAGLRRAGVDVANAESVDAVVGGWLAETPVGQWYRGLSVGRSHGLIVALMTYADAAGIDLAAGRTIAGTGTIAGDGSVGTIGDLVAKATAARHIGADVLVYPAQQSSHLDGFDPGEMELVGVSSLDEAIAALTR